MSRADILALDAMGVIYRAGDDVAELLVPFIAEHGGETDAEAVAARYLEASLGRSAAADFWRAVGLSPDLEDAYLSRHALRADVEGVLARPGFTAVCCISNDVAEWSRKLRVRHGLERGVSRWFVSGDLGHRKPDPRIFEIVLDAFGTPPERILFVDDRSRNLDAAAALGLQTAWLSATADARVVHRRIGTLDEL